MTHSLSSFRWLEDLISEEKPVTSISSGSTVASSPVVRHSIMDTFNESCLEIDPTLLQALLMITEEDVVPMNSDTGLGDTAALNRMKEEAEKDFQNWKQTRKLIKRLSKQDSDISTTRTLSYRHSSPNFGNI